MTHVEVPRCGVQRAGAKPHPKGRGARRGAESNLAAMLSADPHVQAAPSPEVLRFLGGSLGVHIAGETRAAAAGGAFPVLDPSSGETLAEVALAGSGDVDDAVAAARAAQPGWAAMAPAERASLLWSLGDALLRNAEELAQLDTLDNGKPIGESRALDVPLSAGIFHFYAGLVQTIAGRVLPTSVGPMHAYSRREPVGVVAAIVPWNFPLLMCAYKLGPALAAGNSVVLKPAEQTPLSALRLAQLVAECGFPPGVVNVLPGFGETTGAPLAAHPGVDKVTFTGSTEVGRRIGAQSGERLMRATLELGGTCPNVIFADADLDAAADGAYGGAFFNQGQCCVGGSRLLVEEPVFDEFVTRLAARASAVRLGRGLEPATEMGPLVSEEQRDRVAGAVARATGAGAEALAGGAPCQVPESPGGYFFSPTVLVGAARDSEIMREETFGPVVCATPFRDEGEAIELANDTPYGLAAGVWTTRLDRAHRMAAAIDAGTVWVNTYGMFDPAASYGGRHLSGHGRELGVESLDGYLQEKTVWVSLA